MPALAVGALLRVACLLVLAADIPIEGDSNGYVYIARSIREHGVYTDIVFSPDAHPPGREGVRPPLYPYLLAAGLDTDSTPAAPWPWAYALQVLADLGTLLLAADLARRRFGTRAGRATAWIYALLPPAVFYPAIVILTEPVAGLMTALSLWCLGRLDEARHGSARTRLAWAATTGLALGLGMLTKESGTILLIASLGALVVLWRGVPLARRASAAAALLAVTVLVLLPWCLYTKREYGVVIPTGTYGQLSMVYENWPPGETFKELWLDPPTYPDKIASAQDAFRRSLTEHTALFLRRAWWRLRVLAGPEVILPIYVSMAKDGYTPDVSDTMAGLYAHAWDLQGPWGSTLQTVCTLGVLVFFVLAAAGLALRPDGATSSATLLYLLGFLASIALIVGQDRYRYALFAAAAPFAGLGLLALLGQAPATRESRARMLAVGVLVALTLIATMLVLPAPGKPEG